MSKTIGFDIGSAYTAFCVQEGKDIKMMPTVITLEKKTDRVVATGNDARLMIGRAPSTLNVIRPIQNGFVSDAEATSLLLADILERTAPTSVFERTEVISTLPYGFEKEELALENAIIGAGINTFDFVYTPIAIALGAGMPVDVPAGRLIVDIGAGHSDASIISEGDVVISSIIKTAGNSMTEAIAGYILEAHGIEIGELTAEAIKIKIGTLNPAAPLKSIKISGKARADKNADLRHKVTADAVITSKELIPVLSPIADKITENIISTLTHKNVPAEIASDVTNFGVLLSGGGAMLDGLSAYIQKALKIKVTCTKLPQADAARGLVRIINGGRAFAKFTR